MTWHLDGLSSRSGHAKRILVAKGLLLGQDLEIRTEVSFFVQRVPIAGGCYKSRDGGECRNQSHGGDVVNETSSGTGRLGY